MHRILFLAACLTLIPGVSHASGEWTKVHTKQGELLLDLSFVPSQADQTELFLAGVDMSTGATGFPSMKSLVYWSQDGGQFLKPIQGNLPGGLMGGGFPTVIHFIDSSNGFIGLGEKVFRTANRTLWEGLDVGAEIKDFHFMGPFKGFAVGAKGTILTTSDGGQTWDPVSSGTEVDLGCQFWVDGQRGFAAGHRTTEEEDFEGNVTEVVEEGEVLVTSDGGQTWNKAFETSGVSLCPLFFLPDGQSGWLSVTEPSSDGRSQAFLFGTTDGGLSFTDMGMDTQVGVLNFMFQVPLTLSYIVTMHWDDVLRGHVAGAVFVVEISSGGGGGGGKIYRTADFITRDGGQSWTGTDLGTIDVDLRGGGSAKSDGQALSGHMNSQYEGWMVGENGSIWSYEFSCETHQDCGFGYACNADSRCEALQAPPDPCADGGCVSPDTGSASEGTQDAKPVEADPGGVCPDGDCPGGQGGSCSASATPHGPGSMALGLALVALLLLARRRTDH